MPHVSTKKTESGVALILSILVLAIVTSASIGVALVLNKQISKTTDFLHGVKAFYASDAGVEKILHEFRKEGKDVAGLTTSQNLSNDSKWNITATEGLGEVTISLAKDEVFELSLFNPNDQFTHIDIDNLQFTQLKSPVEVTVIAWNMNDPRENGLNKVLLENTTYNLDLAGMSFPSIPVGHNSRNYRVRLRAVNSGATFNVASSPDLMPNLILITSNGTSPQSNPVRHAEQALEILFSTVGTVPSIFDFVLFSEGDIIK